MQNLSNPTMTTETTIEKFQRKALGCASIAAVGGMVLAGGWVLDQQTGFVSRLIDIATDLKNPDTAKNTPQPIIITATAHAGQQVLSESTSILENSPTPTVTSTSETPIAQKVYEGEMEFNKYLVTLKGEALMEKVKDLFIGWYSKADQYVNVNSAFSSIVNLPTNPDFTHPETEPGVAHTPTDIIRYKSAMFFAHDRADLTAPELLGATFDLEGNMALDSNGNGYYAFGVYGNANDRDFMVLSGATAIAQALNPELFQNEDGTFMSIEDIWYDENHKFDSTLTPIIADILSKIQKESLPRSQDEIRRANEGYPNDASHLIPDRYRKMISDQYEACRVYMTGPVVDRDSQTQTTRGIVRKEDQQVSFTRFNGEETMLFTVAINSQTGKYHVLMQGYGGYEDPNIINNGIIDEQQYVSVGEQETGCDTQIVTPTTPAGPSNPAPTAGVLPTLVFTASPITPGSEETPTVVTTRIVTDIPETPNTQTVPTVTPAPTNSEDSLDTPHPEDDSTPRPTNAQENTPSRDNDATEVPEEPTPSFADGGNGLVGYQAMTYAAARYANMSDARAQFSDNSNIKREKKMGRQSIRSKANSFSRSYRAY